MTSLDQALQYTLRELKFMAVDPAGAMNQHKYADKVIEDVTGIPTLCSRVLASAKPLATLLNAVRGPRGNALMKFFNVSLHDTRLEMTMVVAEATRLKGIRTRKSEEAYDYLSSLYRRAVQKARRLVIGKSDGTDTYRDKFQNLQKFSGFGGAGAVGYDDFYEEDDGDDESGVYLGGSEYAEDALEALRNGQPVPQPRAYWPSQSGPQLVGNGNMLDQIRAIENQIGRPMTDAEIDSYLTGEKVVPVAIEGSESPEEYFANLGWQQRGAPPPPENPTEAILSLLAQGISNGDINVQALAQMLLGNNKTGGTEPTPPKIEEAPKEVVVDPNVLKQVPPAGPPIPQNKPVEDPELVDLIRARNGILPASASPATDVEPKDTSASPAAESSEEDGDSPSKQQGPDAVSGPVNSVEEAAPTNSEPGDAAAMVELLDVMRNLNHKSLEIALAKIYQTAGSEMKDAFIALRSSDSPGKVFTLVVYIKAVHSSEMAPPSAIQVAVMNHVRELSAQFQVPVEKFDFCVLTADGGDDTFDNDLRSAYGNQQLFWADGIQKNLECTAILGYYFWMYANIDVRVDYVSDYPISFGKDQVSFVYSLYPKDESLSFGMIRNAFSKFDKSVWLHLIRYFDENVENSVCLNERIPKLAMVIRIPEDLEVQKYLEDCEDLQTQVIRGNNISRIPALQSFTVKTMEEIKRELESDPSGRIDCKINWEITPVMEREVLCHENILTVYPSKKLDQDRQDEISHDVDYTASANISGLMAMLASASAVNFTTIVRFMDPPEDEEVSEEPEGDAASLAVEDLVGSLAQKPPAEGEQTNNFGL